ncbi:MAG: hypothetical protein H0U74_04435 [Bradymonadaceae bacterium]|nr:hypothetical protein [Lujinxingiaceae bacterium]
MTRRFAVMTAVALSSFIVTGTIYMVDKATANSAPTQQPLVYSGVLEENGVAVTGARNIEISLWNDEASTADTNKACSTLADGYQVEKGRFRIALSATCKQAVRKNPDLWVEVRVAGNSLGRSPITPVPYAVSAERRIARVSANGPHDSTCNTAATCSPTPLATRKLDFTKIQADTDLRITYHDNFRSYAADGMARACKWELYLNGSPCSSGAIFGSVYSESDDNHDPGSIRGYCSGVQAGSHTVQVYVSSTANLQGYCHTGFNASTWSIEVEEID